jgi:hypothetical protein
LSAVFVDSVLFGTRLIVHFPLSELLGSVPQTLSVKKVVTRERGMQRPHPFCEAGVTSGKRICEPQVEFSANTLHNYKCNCSAHPSRVQDDQS